MKGCSAPGFKTVAYTYIGSELTWPIYWEGTLGKAKEDLDRAAAAIRQMLAPLHGDARVAVLKATRHAGELGDPGGAARTSRC